VKAIYVLSALGSLGPVAVPRRAAIVRIEAPLLAVVERPIGVSPPAKMTTSSHDDYGVPLSRKQIRN
jgi:hypothetical protein